MYVLGFTHVHDVRVGPALVWLVVFGVFKQNFVHVGAGVLKQLVSAVEDDEGDLTVAQHAQLVRFLHQTKLTLGECHLQKRGRRRINSGSTSVQKYFFPLFSSRCYDLHL